jgi:hypothetical protein
MPYASDGPPEGQPDSNPLRVVAQIVEHFAVKRRTEQIRRMPKS